MSSAVQDLLSVLDLEPLEVNLFRGRSPQVGWQRVFGGQVIGQALVAASRTVESAGRRIRCTPISCSAGDPKVPIIYEVDRIRDGKSFTTRRVVAIQHGQPIFSMSVSFHADEEGLDHQAKMPDVPKPDALPTEAEIKRAHPAADARAGADATTSATARSSCGRWSSTATSARRSSRPLQCLDPDHRPAARRSGDPPLRARLCLGHDAARHGAVPHGRSVFDRDIMAASLDHAMWFHRPFRADEWLLYAQDSPNLHGARGFARGLIFAARRHAGRVGGAGGAAAGAPAASLGCLLRSAADNSGNVPAKISTRRLMF